MRQENDMSGDQQPLSYYLALEYPYTVIPDDGSYFIEYPDLSGCMTQAENASEIAAMADEIRELWLEAAWHDTNLPIPEPVPLNYSGKFVIRLPRSLHRDLSERAKREGVSLNTWVVTLLGQGNGAAGF
jgi:predicted RNase H-like HicB family nuclease